MILTIGQQDLGAASPADSAQVDRRKSATMARAPQAAADTPAGAAGSRAANSPRTIATPATEPGPLTHISIQILRKPGRVRTPRG